MMSLMHIATQSIPMVSCRPVANAIFNLVPTPSVPATSTGERILETPFRPISAPKPPIASRTSGPRVGRATLRKSGINLSLRSMSTPADLYVSRAAIGSDGPPRERRGTPFGFTVGMHHNSFAVTQEFHIGEDFAQFVVIQKKRWIARMARYRLIDEKGVEKQYAPDAQ